ncbi:MAG: glycosyltransferase, partial [Pyrinomonadaceae bacterium]
MSRVCIGVHLHAEPERLRATLDSLRANTPQPFALLLLPDGPDEATRQALALLHTESDATPQLVTAEPHGAAACFNRLASVSSAEVLVLLESGALVGPAWLVYLLAALDSDPRNGIAGPTTNYAWNEQGVYPEAGATPEGIARAALDAARRFGGAAARTLEPLYSLADFCYAVRREVVETIGAAEEAYGLGPCWEMDYNIRAARAGWRGVWAAAAYVHRGPFTARRRREETQRFEASKRLYQDRFCGARLRGEKDDYRAHCRGDACPNFAPPALIRIHHTLPPPAATVLTTQPTDRTQSPLLPEAGQSSPRPDANALDAETQTFANEATLSVSVSAEPLVSCIMPTRDRRPFVPQALRCFLRQDYPHLELLILDDGADAIADGVPDDARVRYVRLGQKLSVGAKRNFACENARGEFIVHWDDDDWYPRRRVGAQLRALLEAGADLCGSSRLWYYDAWAEQAWEYHYAAPGAAWVGGNTLAYRKSFWARNRFPDLQVGEDAHFVWSDVPKTICDMADASLCVASLHPGNTSPKETSGSFWQARPAETVRALLGDEIYFYRTPQHETSAVVAWPLVSCMMPTRNRRAFVPFALQHFLRQDYPRKELIVIDDGDDEVSDLTQGLPGVRYLRC